MSWKEILGTNLEKARVTKGMSLDEASNKLGYGGSGDIVSDYESGMVEQLEISELIEMAAIYDVTIPNLLSGVLPESKSLDISNCTKEEVDVLKAIIAFFNVMRK